MTDADDEVWRGAHALCSAGVLRAVRRAGFPHTLWKEETELELEFEGGGGSRTFCVVVGPHGASDVRIREGSILDTSYAHLAEEEPDSYAETVANWRLTPEPDAAWALGSRLVRPRRIEMTQPYVERVGLAFDCEREGAVIGCLVIFAEADILFIARDDHADVAGYGLRAVAP